MRMALDEARQADSPFVAVIVRDGQVLARGRSPGEPCVMCMGAILWCRIGRLVFAASVEQLATTRDQIMISSADIAAKALLSG
jgi:tRNA(Arg) A34 adenosine deaminase TadA